MVSDRPKRGSPFSPCCILAQVPGLCFAHVNIGPWDAYLNTHTSESDCRHQPTLIALLGHIPSDHVSTKGEPYAQQRRLWVSCPDVQYCSTVVFSVPRRIQLRTRDGDARAYKTYERLVVGDVIGIPLHPRKLTTTPLKPKPPSDFGVTAGAKIALTYDSWEPGICQYDTPTIADYRRTSCEPMCHNDDWSIIWHVLLVRRCKIQTSEPKIR